MGPKSEARNKIVVLVSGGIDSTACVQFYHRQGTSLNALFIEYGQLAVKQEAKASFEVCQYYNIPLKVLSCIGAEEKRGNVINGRNAFLLYTALMEFSAPTGIIAIGIHAGTSYFDCSKQFVQSIQTTFDNYTDGKICIGTPFLEWSKKDIWKFCIKQKVPLELTYSCELGLNQPCGKCISCHNLEILNDR